MGILITFLLGIFLLAGVLVVRLARGSKVIEQFSISIALGTMCSLAMIELIPEIFEISSRIMRKEQKRIRRRRRMWFISE